MCGWDVSRYLPISAVGCCCAVSVQCAFDCRDSLSDGCAGASGGARRVVRVRVTRVARTRAAAGCRMSATGLRYRGPVLVAVRIDVAYGYPRISKRGESVRRHASSHTYCTRTVLDGLQPNAKQSISTAEPNRRCVPRTTDQVNGDPFIDARPARGETVTFPSLRARGR